MNEYSIKRAGFSAELFEELGGTELTFGERIVMVAKMMSVYDQCAAAFDSGEITLEEAGAIWDRKSLENAAMIPVYRRAALN